MRPAAARSTFSRSRSRAIACCSSSKNALERSDLQRENQRFRELVGEAPRMIGRSPAFQLRRPAGDAGRAIRRRRAADRRVGHRQGTAGGAHSPREPVRLGAVRQGELRRDSDRAHRERAVRSRERGVHGRGGRCGAASSSWPTAARSSSTKSAICTKPSQAKLLRILQDGELQRVGGEQPIRVGGARRVGHQPPARRAHRRRTSSGRISSIA